MKTQSIKFIHQHGIYKPDYSAVWFHAGRLYIKAPKDTIKNLETFTDPLSVRLSDRWAWTLRADTAEINEDTISWKYIKE